MPKAAADHLTETHCTHCGLPVPAGLIEPDREIQFCCHGCSSAYDLIHGSGLDSFYRMADAATMKQGKPRESRTQFSEFDETIFQEKYAQRISDEESLIELAIDGIHCGACIWLIEKLPTLQPGVITATANWARRTVAIRWRRKQVALSQVARTLNRIGYRPSSIQASQNENRWKLENRSHLIRIGIAAACAGNNMIISAALYFGMFSFMTAGMTGLLRVASCIVGVVALFWPGRVFLQSAISAIRTRTPHMDLPIALGLFVGTAAGFANVIRGVGEIYFDSLSVLIFLLLIGRWVQFRQQSRAANAVEMLYRLTPQMTRKMVDGQAVEVMVDMVEINDVLQILPGDLFPVDGEIVEGATRVDESILTGESESIAKNAFDSVSAGTRNESSMVLVRAIGIGQETRISKIVSLVENASQDKPEVVQWANRVGGYFVAVVLALAVFTFAFWAIDDVEIAVDRSIALLIVACPCALALATPLAIAVALGRAAGQRIMVKGGDVLQSLQNPGMIWLDKTGTLTEGDLQVVHWHGDTRCLQSVKAIEKASSHPVARAIVRHIDGLEIEAKPNVTAEDHAGKGVVGNDGSGRLLIGNRSLLLDHAVEVGPEFEQLETQIVKDGLSPCWIVCGDDVVAIVALGDSLRSDAAECVRRLQRLGWSVGILSGDHQQIVTRVARRLGIAAENALGEIEPEGKLETIQRSRAAGTVVMVGDGVNDSAALSAATVGIAVKSGAEASLAASPVYLANPGLSPILDLLSLSQSTNRTMRINLMVSLAYNIAFAVLAFAGFINPLVAAILMPISSLTVVALSIRSGRIGKSRTSDANSNQVIAEPLS